MIVIEYTGGRLFTWARGAAIFTVLANVGLFVVPLALAPSAAEVTAHPDVFWSATIAIFLLAPLTGVGYLLAVVLAMEYRVRSIGSADPDRRKKLKQLVLFLAPTSLQIEALVVLIGYALVQ